MWGGIELFIKSAGPGDVIALFFECCDLFVCFCVGGLVKIARTGVGRSAFW